MVVPRAKTSLLKQILSTISGNQLSPLYNRPGILSPPGSCSAHRAGQGVKAGLYVGDETPAQGSVSGSCGGLQLRRWGVASSSARASKGGMGSCKMVPQAGLEPARSCEQQILSLPRLPIPPLGHGAGTWGKHEARSTGAAPDPMDKGAAPR